ncbi:MAG: hypothetical protein JSS75_02540 [Bacteroidetes bacterium]|nr:hypothetical protein [Bacteroidota bacterium]
MAAAQNTLPYLERTPRSGDAQSAPVLVLLHGRAARAETIFSVEGLLDPRFHIISIGAPYESPRGEFEWFLPYDYDHPLESFSEAHFRESEERLTAQIRSMLGERGVTNDRLVIGGFSQGAAMSHILAMRGILKPRGILAMSGFFPRPLESWTVPDAMPDYFISHGTNDQVLPVSESRYAYDFCTAHGLAAEFFEYSGRHKMTIPLLEKVSAWVNEHVHLS